MRSKYARNRSQLYDLLWEYTELWSTELDLLTSNIWYNPNDYKDNIEYLKERTRLSETKARELHNMIFPQTEQHVSLEALYEENIRLKNELCNLDELKLELEKTKNLLEVYKGLVRQFIEIFNPL